MPYTEQTPAWPGWETVRLIGRGSFGAVWEIERNVFGDVEKCALKHISIPQNDSELSEMRSDGLDDKSITQSFADQAKDIVAEYKLMARLNDCPNVVRCHDVDYIQKQSGYGWDIYIRMELLTPFTELLIGQRELPESEIVRLGREIGAALAACRKLNIVHRDIKPQNIFVSREGRFKLGDFGIARIAEKTSSATARTGTYSYMAPEVYHGRRYGASADIYSLGLVLYWLLNERRLPFVSVNTAREKENARVRRFAGEPIPAPAHGGEELRRIVLKACAYDPKDRYQTAEELLRDLEALDTAQSVPAAPAPGGPAAVQAPREIKTAPPPSAQEPAAPLAAEPAEEATVYDPPTTEEKTGYDAPATEEDDGTVGVFNARRIDRSPAPVPPAAEEDATVADRTAYTPKAPRPAPKPAQPAPQKQKEAAPSAPAKKKKLPKWLPLVAVLAVAAVLLIVLLPKNGGSNNEGNWTWSLKNGVLTISGTGNMADFDGGKAPWYDERENIKRIVIKNGIKSIGNMSFWCCTSLRSVEIADSVRVIGDNAFWGCTALKSAEIPSGVKTIGVGAFSSCSTLQSVEIPSTVTTVGDRAFWGCKALQSVKIPSGVTTIGDYAFAYCHSLRAVTIPESVTSIGDYAFAECSSLKDVYYSGTAAQWASLTIGANNEPLLNATVHCNAK